MISASHRLAQRKHDELLDEVCRELEAIWPAARAGRLLHSRVVTQPAAVFSCVPGLDRLRPPQQTPIENLALAGDWTATGWPATMEGAVRSGYRAVEALYAWCRGHACVAMSCDSTHAHASVSTMLFFGRHIEPAPRRPLWEPHFFHALRTSTLHTGGTMAPGTLQATFRAASRTTQSAAAGRRKGRGPRSRAPARRPSRPTGRARRPAA